MDHDADAFYCDLEGASSHYFKFVVRSKYPAGLNPPADWVGSNLVGWYAVRKRDSAVFAWDLGEDKRGAFVK